MSEAEGIYGALGDYERSVRKRKFEIAEKEDVIANLKKALDEMLVENSNLEVEVEKLEIQEKLEAANYEKELKLKAIIESEDQQLMKQCEEKWAELGLVTERLEKVKSFKNTRKLKLKLKETQYIERCKEAIPNVAELLMATEECQRLDTELQNLSDTVAEKRQQLARMSNKHEEDWKKYTLDCVELSEKSLQIKQLENDCAMLEEELKKNNEGKASSFRTDRLPLSASSYNQRNFASNQLDLIRKRHDSYLQRGISSAVQNENIPVNRTGIFLESLNAPTPKLPTPNLPTTKAPTLNSPTSNAPTPNSPTTNAPTPNSPTSTAPTPISPTSNAPTPNSPTSNAPMPNSPTKNAPTPNSPTKNVPTPNSPTKNVPTPNSPTSNAPTPNSQTSNAPMPNSPAKNAPTPNSPTKNAPTSKPTSNSTTSKVPNSPVQNSPNPTVSLPMPFLENLQTPISPNPSTPRYSMPNSPISNPFSFNFSMEGDNNQTPPGSFFGFPFLE